MNIFGDIIEGVSYKERKGVYGIAINENNEVAIIERPLIERPYGDFLPGGGLEEDETEEQCLRRELVEETGYEINIKKFICRGIEFGYAPKVESYLKLVGTFYEIEFKEDTGLKKEIDHKLKWKDIEVLKESMPLEYQLWAIQQAFKLINNN